MKFFLDNCLPPRFAPALSILAERQGNEIIHLRDKFGGDTPDPVWLRALGAEGDWVIVSGDPRITRGRAEQAAWQESGLTAFFFGSGWSEQKFWNQAAEL